MSAARPPFAPVASEPTVAHPQRGARFVRVPETLQTGQSAAYSPTCSTALTPWSKHGWQT